MVGTAGIVLEVSLFRVSFVERFQCIIPRRAVASGLAGSILAGPDFAQETDFLKFKAGHFAHVFRLGGRV